MTPEQFAYWLQGFSEIKNTAPSEEEWKIIQDHLKLVFNKVTPEYHGFNIKENPLLKPNEFRFGPEIIC